MDEVVLILFLAIIVVLAVAVLLMFMILSDNNKDARTASDKPVNRRNKGWKSWIAFLGIALFIAIWTVYGALFFLATVWVMRQNPKRDSSFVVSDNEKNTAKRLYTWLLLSPFVTVPVFIISLISIYSTSSTDQRVLAALIPLIFHTPLLLGLTSNSTFVFRHSQQAILLMAIRGGVASLAINIGSDPWNGIWLFLLGNGSLWLFGSLWGRSQVVRGECWLMRQKGEALKITTGAIEDLTPQVNIEQSTQFIGKYKADEAKKHALAAFRNGDRAVKQQAVQILTNLHEVEKF